MNIEFRQVIGLNGSCDKFWNLFIKALKDSKNTELWPNGLSTSKCENVKKNELIKVTYKFLGLKFNAEYKIVDYVKNKFLIYSPTRNHPLKGRVKISTDKNQVIVWEGKYTNANFFHKTFFFFYEKLFFKDFQNNLISC